MLRRVAASDSDEMTGLWSFACQRATPASRGREAGVAIQDAYPLGDFTAGSRHRPAEAGFAARIDHRSYAQRGIHRESENKIGAAAAGCRG
jgi:hypothetical protein